MPLLGYFQRLLIATDKLNQICERHSRLRIYPVIAVQRSHSGAVIQHSICRFGLTMRQVSVCVRVCVYVCVYVKYQTDSPDCSKT